MDSKELIKAGLENAKRSTDRALDTLTPAELKWQPRPDANSIGLILFHVARVEDAIVQSLLQRKPQVWEQENWYEKLGKDKSDRGGHYTAEQVASFCVPDLKDLHEYTAAVRKRTLEYLEDMTAEKLDLKVELPSMGPSPSPAPGGQDPPPRRLPFEPIIGSMLLMTVTHSVQHAGEISYLRGLQRGMDK
jgi:uncharacterized damage-inducible protein DinB